MQYKAVARLFWTRGGEGARGALSRVPKTRALWGGVGGGGGGGGGVLENFQIWMLRNAIFSTFHEMCLRKVDLE